MSSSGLFRRARAAPKPGVLRLVPRLSRIAVVPILIVLPAAIAAGGEARQGAGPLVAIAVETRDNTLDGCIACGCRAKGELEPGAEGVWWIAFGLVAADAEGGWSAAGASSRCGSGPFDEVAAAYEQTIGTPYLIAELSTTAAVPPAGDADLEARLSLRKLSGLGADGRAVYASGSQERRLGLAGEGEITFPLLVPDDEEREAFAVHEVLVRLRAAVVGWGSAVSYGTLAVTADVPGAEILLDGGFVGRVGGGGATILKNVPAGKREIRVRDFSGREARREVTVEEQGAVDLVLGVLDLSSAETGKALVPVGENPQGYPEYWRVRDGALMVTIPEGEFLRGSAEDQGKADERPQRTVYLSDFLIDKTEVTWRQFRRFAEATDSRLPDAPVWGTPDDYAVSFISWEDATAYCAWVGGRLPTEAEWEKAARGSDGRVYPWGDDWDPGRCNSISGGMHRPESVGSYRDCLSPHGLLDIPGSMWEWCADWYGEDYYAESPSRDPEGPESGTLRVIRGGGWMSQPLWLRGAHRAKASPPSAGADFGFRCAQDPPGSDGD